MFDLLVEIDCKTGSYREPCWGAELHTKNIVSIAIYMTFRTIMHLNGLLLCHIHLSSSAPSYASPQYRHSTLRTALELEQTQ
jgi:hypothetical protein